MNKTLVAATLVVALGASPALAADPAYPELILTDAPNANVWDGFYAGVLGGFWNGNSLYLLGGGSVGANFTVSNNFVLGVEGRGIVYSDGDFGFDGTARVGAAFDQVLVYADGGFGIRDGAGHVFVGGGAEVALMDNLSLDGRLEFVTGTGFNAVRGTAGLNFHF
jgi:opacity protein-like surface antigen